MNVGDHVTIQRGPFKLFPATIDRIVGDAIHVSVEIFGRTTPVTITAGDLVADDPRAVPSREREIELAIRGRRAFGWVVRQFFRLESRRDPPREPEVLY